MPERNDRPVEEWTDQELLDQLAAGHVLPEERTEVHPDDDSSPEAAIKAEIARRGLEPPTGSD